MLGAIQLVSVVLLIVAGVLALGRRGSLARWVLIGAFGVQVLLAVYWAVRLTTAFSDGYGATPTASFVGLSLFFAAPPVVGLGLIVFGSGRRWFAVPRAAVGGAGQPG